MQTPRLPEAGSRLRDRYDIVRSIKSGGMGAVYEVSDGTTRLAVKFPTVDLVDRDAVDRFKREARVLSQIDSAHVVRVIEMAETDNGLPFIVMEFLEGRDLAGELSARGPLPVAEACRFIRQACLGVSAAHARGIIHRDIKPGNLFLCDKDEKASPDEDRLLKVLDFGISKLLAGDGTARTSTGDALGTPAYMSPEQLVSSASVDERTDVWALGVVLYRLLTNALPFSGASPVALALAITTRGPDLVSKHRSGVPKALDRVIRKALAKEIGERYASVDELADALRPFTDPEATVEATDEASESISLGGESPSTKKPLFIEPAPLGAPRTRGWILPVGLGVTVVAAIAGFVALRQPSPENGNSVERAFGAPSAGANAVAPASPTGGERKAARRGAAAVSPPIEAAPVVIAGNSAGASSAPPFDPSVCFSRVGFWTTYGALPPSALHAEDLETITTQCYRNSLSVKKQPWSGEVNMQLRFDRTGRFSGAVIPDTSMVMWNFRQCVQASAMAHVQDTLTNPKQSRETTFTTTVTFTCPNR